MELKINGCSTVTELIAKSKVAEMTLNRNPNLMLISTTLGDMLMYEIQGDKLEKPFPRWKQLIDASYMGMLVKVVNNKGHEYLELFEVEH